jgi:hypothetical protein|tara:strand:+ start:356 stop:610 length:255 start_codon:yes stop_codon:yes gene_type:complete
MTSRKQSTKKAKKRTSQIRNNELLDYLKKIEEMGSMQKMINSNPRGGMRSGRYTASTGGRVPYNKGGSTQPEYKSGDMPKCMPK